MNTSDFTRRGFLRQLTLVGTAMLLPVPAAEAGHGSWVAVGRARAFPVGPVHALTLPGGRPISLRRLPGRTPKFLALSAVCTHKGCRVVWKAADHRFHCPCHGGLFDADGRNVAGPPPRPLAALPTKVQNGTVYVLA